MPNSNFLSVAIDVGNTIQLFKFNKEEMLDNIVKLVCEENNISYSKDKYAFQYIRDQSSKKLGAKYVTEENRNNIVNGTELKLVYSPKEISEMIHENFQNKGDVCWALEKLSGHVNDEVFVKEVFLTCYPYILEHLNDENLPPKLFSCCLKAILGFLKYDCILDISSLLLKRLIKYINSESHIESSVIENSLRLIELSLAKHQYTQIIEMISIEDLIPHLWDRDSPIVQECALGVMNNLAYYCRVEDEKTQLLKTMNSHQLKSTIASNVLYQGAEPSQEIAEQLYLYQKQILRLVLNQLTPIMMDFNSLPDYELVIGSKRHSHFENSPRSSIFESTGSSRSSRELATPNQTDRSSFGWKAEGLTSKRDYLKLSFLNLDITELHKDVSDNPDIITINELVYNCIMYFSKHYHKNYQCSLYSEGCSNFVMTCNDIVHLVIYDVLRIEEPPVPGCTAYFPLVFAVYKSQTFIEELFCFAMWLYERTRREMKAKNHEDYKKVLKVMERQLTEGLMAQPKSFTELECILRRFSYSAISEQWQIERKAKEQHFLTTSPAVKELRISLKGEMIQLIKEQRLNYVINGSKFPVWNPQRCQKVKDNFWYAQVSTNKKFIFYLDGLYYTSDDERPEDRSLYKSIHIRDINEIVVGKKCPHLKDLKVKDRHENILAFSLVLDPHENKTLDFIASSKKMYEYWLDALNILTGNKMKSLLFREELNTLLEMEVKIKLLDVEGIDCPNDPPEVPPLPENFDFNL